MKIYSDITNQFQSGGKKLRDSSSSSSDDDKLFRKLYKIRREKYNRPVVYFHYIPSIYDFDDYIDSIFIPVFTYPITPYIEIATFSTAFWG
jgi:hypothetical protein